MIHGISAADERFSEDFNAGRVTPADFDHRAHVRLAYIYIVQSGVGPAVDRMRAALLAFLARNSVDPAKYHETITAAWIRAVRHFMENSPQSASAEEFIDANPRLLDPNIMLTHYSAEVLFSAEARARYTPPDVEPIPEY